MYIYNVCLVLIYIYMCVYSLCILVHSYVYYVQGWFMRGVCAMLQNQSRILNKGAMIWSRVGVYCVYCTRLLRRPTPPPTLTNTHFPSETIPIVFIRTRRAQLTVPRIQTQTNTHSRARAHRWTGRSRKIV